MLILLCTVGVAWAQDEDSNGGTSSSADSYAPAAGDYSGAILFGRGMFVTNGLNLPSSIRVFTNGTVTTISGSSPDASGVVGDYNSSTNMIGGEARYFITDQIAVKLGGAVIIRNTPDRPNIPAPTNQSNFAGGAAAIPNYAAVTAENNVDLAMNLAGEYHFASKYDRLFPYVGLNLPFFHGRRSAYDPTITIESDGSATITDVSVRHVELFGFGAEAAAGVDYYLMEGFYFGLEIKPVSYLYLFTNKYPGAGLEELGADTHTLSFFSRPMLKVGFRF